MTIIDDGVVLETVWTGAEGWLDDKRGDYPPKMLGRVAYAEDAPAKPQLAPNAYRRVLACLPQATRWTTERLREEACLTPAEFERALGQLRREGVLVSVKRGVVAVNKMGAPSKVAA